MRFSSSPSARKKTTTLAIEHLERREMMSGDSVYDPIAHVAPMIPGDTEEVLRQRIGDIGDRVHALTQMTDWRERDDVIDDVATSLATLNEDLSAPSTIQSDALTALRATLHDEIFKEFDIAKTMTPDDVVLDHGKKNDIEFSGVQAGRYENGATITVNRETLRLESQSGGNVIVSQGKLQGENQGGVTMTFVDEHGAPVMRGVRFVRVDPIPYAELGGTVIFHTPSGDVRFAAQYQQYSLDNNFLASSIRLEPDGKKSAGISTVMFIDPTPPVLLPDVPDTQPNDVPPVWEHWTTHALPTMETQAGLEAKNNANNALSAFLGAMIDEDAITKQIDNLTKDRDGVRTTITDLETQRETYRHDSQLLADKTTVYEKRKNELLTARQASNDALTAWKADRTNTTLWNAYQSANANFVTIKNAYAKDRPTFVGEMEAARPAGTKANYYLPKIEEKLRAAKQQEIDLTSTIDGLATDLETARNRTTNVSGILNEATVEAAENDDTMLARSVPDFTSMECVMNADNTCASATVSLGALGGTLTIAGWQGALHTSPTMEGLADNSPSPVNAVSAKANGVSIDLSGSEHRVTRIVFTPESSGTEPLTVVVYRGETELCSMAAMPGEQCIIEETEGITGIVILPQMHALSPIAAELRGALNQVQYMDPLTRRMIEHHVTWEQYKPYIPGREIETAMFFFDRYPQMIFEEQLAVIAEMRAGKQTDTVFLHDLAVDALMNKKQIDAKPMSPMATHALGMMGYDWNEHDNAGEIANRIGRGGGFVGVRLNDNMMEGNYRGFTYNMSGSSAPMPTALYWIDGDAHMRELPSWAYIIRGRTIVLLPNTPRCIFTNLDQPFTYSMTGNPAFSETSESLIPPVEMTLDYFFVHKKNGPSGQEGFASPYINVADTVDFKFGTAEFWGNIVNKGTTGGPFTVDIYTGMTGTTQDTHVHTFTGTIAGQQTIGFKFFSDTTITGYVTVAMTTPDGRVSIVNIGIPKPHFRSEDPDSPAVIASQQPPKDEATLVLASLQKVYGEGIYTDGTSILTADGSKIFSISNVSDQLIGLLHNSSYVDSSSVNPVVITPDLSNDKNAIDAFFHEIFANANDPADITTVVRMTDSLWMGAEGMNVIDASRIASASQSIDPDQYHTFLYQGFIGGCIQEGMTPKDFMQRLLGGITGLDAASDFCQLSYDLDEFEAKGFSFGLLGSTILDGASLLPVAGAIKPISKYAAGRTLANDTTEVSVLFKNADGTTASIKGKLILKNADELEAFVQRNIENISREIPTDKILITHIGRTNQELLKRLTEEGLKDASSFFSTEEYRKALALLYKQNGGAIDDWYIHAKPGSKRPFIINSTEVLGNVVSSTRQSTTSSAYLWLYKNPNGLLELFDAYPILQ